MCVVFKLRSRAHRGTLWSGAAIAFIWLGFQITPRASCRLKLRGFIGLGFERRTSWELQKRRGPLASGSEWDQ